MIVCGLASDGGLLGRKGAGGRKRSPRSCLAFVRAVLVVGFRVLIRSYFGRRDHP
jgi:hypothetical protein